MTPDRGAILVRHGKGNKRRDVGMDQWGSELLRPWLACRVQMPVGPLFCVLDGRTRGRPLTTTSVRTSIYLQGIDNAEIIGTVHARRAPMIPAGARLRRR